MSNWVSAESDLFNAIFNRVLQSPLANAVTSVEDGVKKDLQTPYIVIGETDVIENKTPTSMREDIAIQMHVYADSKPDCREFLVGLKKIVKEDAENNLNLEHYEIEKINLSNQQVMTDVDQYTSHGVLRLSYTVRHFTLYQKQGVSE